MKRQNAGKIPPRSAPFPLAEIFLVLLPFEVPPQSFLRVVTWLQSLQHRCSNCRTFASVVGPKPCWFASPADARHGCSQWMFRVEPPRGSQTLLLFGPHSRGRVLLPRIIYFDFVR